MAKLRGLQLRGRTYYSRIVVPKELVPRFGRREIWKSLRTSKRTKAEALHLQEALWSAAFMEAAATRPKVRNGSKADTSDCSKGRRTDLLRVATES